MRRRNSNTNNKNYETELDGKWAGNSLIIFMILYPVIYVWKDL
jgi:hypothetical protein